mmetsp:Transcript_22991/g.19957  ORF Transcript_22991/g.19957 Transcript_22991/m.19957 type:complete len:118 (-) Transcript_22991:297-650(-)|eukprot:CAMPEP_0114592458 /NCGR_PEP_ID=MMETSP0125-20121206/14280_1 /TAXON_ID=485358 ORGANISM="Aristerostoma sp., Strain ATCC 50986" /NCGR_SAMPLE_ID=MMETSP0125 /ASSEMBLY_ACC=CAM_ASM_000245 /LENGTH=117 /DNA_ID=CAMNT_0001791113 /DNA_START=334 /DNA_END=687 /DNA_ORIENTATION=+
MFFALVMVLFWISMFTCFWVFIANEDLEQDYLDKGYAIGYFCFFLPASLIEVGSCLTLNRCIKALKAQKPIELQHSLVHVNSQAQKAIQYTKSGMNTDRRSNMGPGSDRGDIEYDGY